MAEPAEDPETGLWKIAEEVLTPRQLEIARLHWKRGLSTRQIATMLGISRGNVQDAIRSSRAAIARAVADA
jgi:DNA-binding CsgD family transcriptional regulator